MKFYGIETEGYLKLRQFTDNPPTFDTVGTTDDRKLIYVNDTLNTEDAVYIGGVQSNTWTRVVLDDGASYPTLEANFDTLYHPKNGTDSDVFRALRVNGASADNKLQTQEDWIYVAADDPVDTVGGQGKRWAGLLVEVDPTGNPNDDAAVYYDGTVTADPDTQGWDWKVKGPNYVGTSQTIATREWANSKFVGTGSGVTLTYLNANHYTKTESDNKYVTSTDAATRDITDWSDRLVYDEAGTGTLPTNAVRFAKIAESGGIYSNALGASHVVKRNSSGDIYARIGVLTATTAQYADLAEKYTCDKTLPVGTVVEVSDGTEYEVAPCMFEYSPSVVGVVSENPAYLMNSTSSGLPIALTGKVPVRVIGGVRKGDFLIPAGNGVARKGEPSEISFKFAVSLETSLQEEEKLVECIVK